MFIELPILARRAGEERKLFEQLVELASHPDRFGVRRDPEDGSNLLLGHSEDELEILIANARERGIEFEIGAPQVAYRETLTRAVTVKYTHKKQTDVSGQFAEVTIDFKPLPPGSGFVFENEVVRGSVPEEFIPSIEKGLMTQKEAGLLAGFPVIDFKAALIDGKYHEVDSNALTFEIAARAAFRELAPKGVVKMLEPVMKVEIVTPEEFLGGVIGDLNSRRGQVQGTDADGGLQIVSALVPIANMFGYKNTLYSMCQGRSRYTSVFHHYAAVPTPDDDDPRFSPAAAMRLRSA